MNIQDFIPPTDSMQKLMAWVIGLLVFIIMFMAKSIKYYRKTLKEEKIESKDEKEQLINLLTKEDDDK